MEDWNYFIRAALAVLHRDDMKNGMNCIRLILTKGWIHPFLQNRPSAKQLERLKIEYILPPKTDAMPFAFASVSILLQYVYASNKEQVSGVVYIFIYSAVTSLYCWHRGKGEEADGVSVRWTLYLSRYFILVEIISVNQSEARLLSLPQVCKSLREIDQLTLTREKWKLPK